jgi:predicted N-formylglutamate amidohydrolase
MNGATRRGFCPFVSLFHCVSLLSSHEPRDTTLPGQPPAFEIINADAPPRLVFVCDHASNALPESYGTLGLSADLFGRHIAYDIGAADVTRAFAGAFNAPAILGKFSRLLIDLNRGADDPTLVMKLSDGAIVPGNATADANEIRDRIARFYRPYHDAIEAQIARARAENIAPVIVSIHSFTPEWKGRKRPWQVGVLWDPKDGRLALPLLEELRRERDLVVGDNEPYSGELEGDCMSQHALAHGLAHVLIEIRQDLIADRAGATAWSNRLVPILRASLKRLESSQPSEAAMNDTIRNEIEAAVFRRLVAHLQKRTDVQNIDLMNLAGFCRNCLGDWYKDAAAEHGIEIPKDDARARVYGMPQADWKSRYQKEASPEQKAAFEKSHKNH